MRDEMLPAIVLARLRHRDEVHILRLDTDPENQVEMLRLTRNVGMGREIAAFFTTVQKINQPSKYRGSTNIGGILAYAKRISMTLQESAKQAEARGKPRPISPRFVVSIFTDGKPEGIQTQPQQGPWPTQVEVWFWGVEAKHEDALKQWAVTKMQLPEAQLHIVRFIDWQTVVAHTFGRHVGRPHPNTAVLKRLGVTYTMAKP